LDGQSAWVRVNRFAAKTFNTVYFTDLPDTNGAGKIYVTDSADVPIDQDAFVLWTRTGNQILETHHGRRPDGNVYDETMLVVSGLPADSYEIQGPVISGQVIVLPLDSRDSSSVQEYIVGSGQLEIFLNGQYLVLDNDWTEFGVSGSLSKRITINQDLAIDDFLTFRIDANGAVFFASSSGGGGGGGSLQDAYDVSRFINVVTGLPIVITGASGKLMSIQGDLEVTGVIDPTALQLTPQASNPLPLDQAGIWVSTSNEFMYQKGDNTAPDSITAAISGGLSASSLTATLINNTGSTLAEKTPVRINTNGWLDTIDVSTDSGALTIVGLTDGSITHGNTGEVLLSGCLKNVITAFSFGDVLYVSKTGDITNVKPDIGVSGFIAGDFVIKLGIISRNISNPVNKDFIINITIVGQL